MDAGEGRRTKIETLPAEEITRLLGQLGHEVGTPLGSVLMMAEMLGDTDDPGLRRRAEGLKQAASEVRDAVQAFVQIVRLRTGWLGPRPTDVSGDAIVRAMRSKAQDVTVTQTPPEGYLDLDYLHEAAECLGSWAETHSSDAGMEIGVEAATDSDPVRFYCEIRCAGRAVPWHEAAIFDPLGTGDLVAARRHGGPGLQLAVAAALVWRLGGELTGGLDSSGPGEAGENAVRLVVPICIEDPLAA